MAKYRGVQQSPFGERQSLTPRQRECVLLAAEGLSAPEMAEKLCISYQTAKNTLFAARNRLGAKTIAHAVYLFIGGDGIKS